MGRYGIDWNKSEEGLTEEDYNTILTETSKIINEKIVEKKELAIAFYDRGVFFMKKGDYQQAVSDFSSAAELRSDHSATYHNLGLSLYILGIHIDSLINFRKAFEIDPEDRNTQKWINFILNLNENLI